MLMPNPKSFSLFTTFERDGRLSRPRGESAATSSIDGAGLGKPCHRDTSMMTSAAKANAAGMAA
jgi:hypothetical protein